MSNITLHPSFATTFKIQVGNRDPNIMPSSIFGQNGPVFQLENSEFDGINELSQTQTKIVSISLKNVQKEIDVNINVEQCNYDYKGTFNIIGNKFGFLGTQVNPKLFFFHARYIIFSLQNASQFSILLEYDIKYYIYIAQGIH